jgi:hypothetical protein
MAAVIYFAGAWGYLRLLRLPVPPGEPSAVPGSGSLLGNSTLLLALGAVMLTAILAGVLVIAARVSPLAAGLPGALLLAWTALYVVNVRRAVELIPLRAQVFGAGWEALLVNGILGAAGAVMILPVLIPSRWRRARAAGPDTIARQAEEQLTAIWPGARPRQPDERYPEEQYPEEQYPQEAQREGEPALTGTVISSPASSPVWPVDTTRVTGASRALRATGSFSTVPGSTPRATGSFGPGGDTSLLGRPYYQTPDQ